ncbi:MAG: 50S ribosomal protein L13 [Candidatus Omnitrophica bacterium]|nr:50S ribosomal protein L13 [Candidatus Omnitrophota bacterium]MCM8770367.1 50S ribosomal protein L13 [Candidatus Omnitrophota bacterium]
MGKTFMAKSKEIKRTWYLVDAKDKILGRLATRVAMVLRGKHKPIYTPNIDTGDGVIVINAAKVKVTGRKMEQKLYRRYSGYPGGLKEINLARMLSEKPEQVFKLAVKRMLSSGPLGRKQFRKLKVYASDKHPHLAQRPIPLEV